MINNFDTFPNLISYQISGLVEFSPDEILNNAALTASYRGKMMSLDVILSDNTFKFSILLYSTLLIILFLILMIKF